MAAPRNNAGHDQNFVPTLIGVSTADGSTPVPVEVDPLTGAMQVAGGTGGSSGNLATAAKSTTAAGSPTSTAASTTRQPLDVTLYDTSGNPVSVGGGTQYTNQSAQTAASAIGTLVLGYDGSNVRAIATDTGGNVILSSSSAGVQAGGATVGVATTVAVMAGIRSSAGTQAIIAGMSDSADAVGTNGGGNNLRTGALTYGFNGTSWDRLRVDANKNLQVNVNAALPAGTNVVGKVSIDQTTPGTTNFVAANLTQINGAAISVTNPLPAQIVAAAGAGFTPYKYISAASTNATNVKASAGTVGVISLQNNSSTIYYVKLYDKASAPTVGTDVPVHTLLVPANASGAGNNEGLPDEGLAFANGISFAITAGIADSDTAPAAANAITVNLGYK